MASVGLERLSDLLRPEAYLHPAQDLRLIETHISWVVLVGQYAYKLRKPVDFGFVDFSTPEKRRADCEAEVTLNRRLCPELYLGVVDVVERDGTLHIGGPGALVEHAVRMRRLPESGMLAALLQRGAADERLVLRLARRLADFHALAATGPEVDGYGSLDIIRANWDENFAQTTDLDPTVRNAIRAYVDDFLGTNERLLTRRIHTGRIRDGHGDLHVGSVWATRRRLYLFDCLEFSARFRCADVAADVAFLAMDLDHFGRADLSGAFVDEYVRRSGDLELRLLLDFYKSYRAYVRGKVLRLRLAQPGLDRAEAEDIAQDSSAYFDLAYTYASRPAQPTLVVVMGLPATGKTTLARALASRLSLVHVSSDIVRKRLVGLSPTTHSAGAFGRGLYSQSMTHRTYLAMLHKAGRWLRRGQSVVLDATFGKPAERSAIHQLASRSAARLLVVVCRAEQSVLLARLAARAADPYSASDARVEIWPALRAAFVAPIELPLALTLDTSRPLNVVLAELLAAVRSTTCVGRRSGGRPQVRKRLRGASWPARRRGHRSVA